MLLFIIVLVIICPIVFAVSSANSNNTALQQVVTLNPDIKNKEDYLAARQVIDEKQQTIQEKRAKYSKFHPGILMSILVVLEIIVLTIINPKFNFTLFCSIIIIFALELIFGVIGHDKKVNKIKEFDKKLQTINDEYYQIACSYLANYHNITVEKLLYDLPYVFNAQINQTNWWLSLNNIDVINEALKIKYNYVMTDIEKSNLQVQQLKLQNEGIAIDNQQKKFWTCNFCGNMNRAEDMQCIKCGGQRSI